MSALLTMAGTLTGIDLAIGTKFAKTQPKALVIGYSDIQQDGIDHQLGEIGYSSEQPDQFTINCRAEADIDTDVVTATQAAYGLLNDLADLIAANPTLGVDAITQTWISHVAWAATQTERGYRAVVPFGVTCDAWTGI